MRTHRASQQATRSSHAQYCSLLLVATLHFSARSGLLQAFGYGFGAQLRPVGTMLMSVVAGAGRPGCGQTLQVLRIAAHPYDGVLCHRKLGWMAILQELLKD